MKETKKIKIGNKWIDRGDPCFIVAEAGINHNGSLKLAKKMIETAKKCGADAIKFQTFKTEEFISDKKAIFTYKSQGKTIKEPMYQLFKKWEFSPKEWQEIKRYADKKKIIFFSTAQNQSDLEMLLKIGVPAIKVGSDDLTHLPQLKEYAKKNLPMIISTGMSTLQEVRAAVETIKRTGNHKLILLHCTSAYPTPAGEANLKRVITLRKKFRVNVGFSDHTEGFFAALGAVALGAVLIEKHFTLNRNLPGPDQWFSSDPKEFSQLVKAVRYIERALGNGEIKLTKTEKKIKPLARRSIVAKRNLEKGRKIIFADIDYKRPGTGIPPSQVYKIVGRITRVKIKKDEQITWQKIK